MKQKEKLSCPFCSKYEFAYNVPDYVSGQSFPLMECTQCGIGMTDTTDINPNDSVYYSDYYYGENNQKFHPLLEKTISWFRNQRAKRLQMYFKQSGNVFDIGCGRGHLLHLLKQAGWNCIGTELTEASSQYARNHYKLDVRLTENIEDLNLAPESQHLVTMFHVFEHVENPAQTLEQIHDILIPGGLLVIEVPNFDSWQAQWWGANWHHLDPPRHLFHFTKKGLLQMIDQHGFKAVEISTWSLEFGPFGMVQSMLNAISFEYNFLFKVLKGKWRRKNRNMLKLFADSIVHLLFFIPALYFSILAEVLSVMAQRGGVIYLVAQKKVNEH